MRIILSVIVFITMFLSSSYAQESTFIKSQIVDASADQVWERLRQLDGLEDIVPDLLASSWIHNDAKPGVGCERSCAAPGTPKGQASYTERITKFSDQERFYEYAVIAGTPTKNMVNSLRVTDLGYNKCMVTWTSTREGYINNPQMTEEEFNAFLSMAGTSIVDGVASLYNGQ